MVKWEDKEKLVKITGLALIVIISFVAGFLTKDFFGTNKQQKIIVNLSEEDKNFMLNLANAQSNLTALKSDWCLAKGGIWYEPKQETTIEINYQTAQELRTKGIRVIEKDGKYYTDIVLVRREGCIFTSNK
ncbi:MAG: hypothetical protein N3D73_02975 [Candidatus Diapherotrites archaeon]|nr:hypothetical protein [Candidatus Diapherotrites archaeon]